MTDIFYENLMEYSGVDLDLRITLMVNIGHSNVSLSFSIQVLVSRFYLDHKIFPTY